MDLFQYFIFDISFDIKSIIENIKNGYSYPRHSKSLYFLFSILDTNFKIYLFNSLAFLISVFFFLFKKKNFLLFSTILVLGLVTRLPLYYLKDNFLVYFLIIFFGLISLDGLKSKVNIFDFVVFYLYCFLAIIHSQFYLTVIIPVFIILIKYKIIHRYYSLLGLISIVVIILSLNELTPPSDKYYKPKLVNTYAGDIKNIYLNNGDYKIDQRMIHPDIKDSNELEICIKDAEPLFDIMAPKGVINADPFFINECLSINEPKLNSLQILKSYFILLTNHPIEIINTKIKHFYQLIIKPGEIGIKWLIKIFLGPIIYLSLLLYFFWKKQNKLIFDNLTYLLPHLILIILIGPGYDLRYTFPQLFMGYFILSYLVYKYFINSK